MSTTVVSAYYRINSKYDHDKYGAWIKNFMSIEMKTVIYGDSASIQFLNELYPRSSNRMYIEREFKDFYTSKWDWQKDEANDPEIQIGHNEKLYKIWNEKIFMVFDTICENPYETDTFTWIDIGCFRNDSAMNNFMGFPNSDTFSKNTVSMTQIEEFIDSDYTNIYPVDNRFLERVTVAAGLFAGGIEPLIKLKNLYEDILDEADKLNVFKGKDQNMYAFCILRSPELFTILNPVKTGDDIWFGGQVLWTPRRLNFIIVGPGIMPIPPTGWGACEILIWDYVCELRNLGHNVEIINTTDLQTIIDEIIEKKPDFVHIQYDEHAEIAHKIAPYVRGVGITSHFGYLEQESRWETYKNVFGKIVEQQSQKVHHLVFSKGISNVYAKNNVDPNSIHITPNGANHTLFRKAKSPEFPDRSIVVGKIEDRKRQVFLMNNTDVWFVGNKCASNFDYECPRWLGEWDKETLYNSLTDYGNLVLLSDGEADPLVVKEALVAGLGVVVSTWAAANLDTSQPFITVIPNEKLSDLEFVSEAIRKNREVSVKMREAIFNYSERFYWSKLIKTYVILIRNLIGY